MDLKEHALRIRRNIIEAGYHGGAMHFGGSLSMVDIMAYLYGEKMQHNPADPCSPTRDRFILSKGHCSLSLYATLCEFGYISRDLLMTVEANGSELPSHCVQNLKYGIELSSGSLGLGLGFAIGQSLGLPGIKLYVLVGNGETNEGSFWETVSFAGAKHIENVCVVVDNNGMQLDGFSSEVLPIDNLPERFRAFGWKVAEANGHDFDSLRAAFNTEHAGCPLAIVASTTKGKGIPFMENRPEWHHNKMTEEQYNEAMAALGGAQ